MFPENTIEANLMILPGAIKLSEQTSPLVSKECDKQLTMRKAHNYGYLSLSKGRLKNTTNSTPTPIGDRTYERGAQEVHRTRDQSALGPARMKVRKQIFSVIKPKITNLSQLPVYQLIYI